MLRDCGARKERQHLFGTATVPAISHAPGERSYRLKTRPANLDTIRYGRIRPSSSFIGLEYGCGREGSNTRLVGFWRPAYNPPAHSDFHDSVGGAKPLLWAWIDSTVRAKHDWIPPIFCDSTVAIPLSD